MVVLVLVQFLLNFDIHIGSCLNTVTVGRYNIHFHEGNHINIHYPLLQCFGRTQINIYICTGNWTAGILTIDPKFRCGKMSLVSLVLTSMD